MTRKMLPDANDQLTRRNALRALATGAGAVILSSATDARADRGRGHDDDDDDDDGRLSQWLAWDDGFAYRIKRVDRRTGEWLIRFDDGRHTIDPSGHVMDSGIWYEIAEVDCEGVWYDGEDGFFYLLPFDDNESESLV